MPKQSELDGMERPAIKEIEEAAEEYVKVRDKRMALTEKEISAKIALLAVMSANKAKLSKNGDGELVYRYDDELVILKEGKLNVKVKRAHDGEEDEEEE